MRKLVSGRSWLKRTLFNFIACCALSGAAHAADCKSQQKGNEIFADNFADATGGWQGGDGSSFGKPAMTLTLLGQATNWQFFNNTFNATDGDYCMEAVVPRSPAPDNSAAVGLVALSSDANNFLMLLMGTNSSVFLYRMVANTWITAETMTLPGAPPAPGSVVTIRMTVKGTLITPFINGIELQKIRVQVPTGPLKFGVWIQLAKPMPNFAFQFNNYRVTSGE
jgi:hypothetical protein